MRKNKKSSRNVIDDDSVDKTIGSSGEELNTNATNHVIIVEPVPHVSGFSHDSGLDAGNYAAWSNLDNDVHKMAKDAVLGLWEAFMAKHKAKSNTSKPASEPPIVQSVDINANATSYARATGIRQGVISNGNNQKRKLAEREAINPNYCNFTNAQDCYRKHLEDRINYQRQLEYKQKASRDCLATPVTEKKCKYEACSIFYNLDMDLIGAEERVGLFAFILTFLLSTTVEALPIFLQEREILMKETSCGTYRVSSYAIANGLVYLPFLLILAILFATPLYWLVGLNPSFFAFSRFLLLIWLILYTANSVVVCFSALVPNFIVGNSVISGVMGSFFLFSGYFVSKQGMPKYWIFMHYISLFKYPFEGLLMNEFSSGEVTGEDVLREQGGYDDKEGLFHMLFLGLDAPKRDLKMPFFNS
ncbi:ABC-2 type transporter family protein [Artemisia annua]|uniref:ABC-2 type transporter family protein n=1 Tax=Artemisia annua TaxID=35608 RepID=A0A2U1M9I5_ARTAN|nr:ABC-2 type transporter family protein [Artemisia annua]